MRPKGEEEMSFTILLGVLGLAFVWPGQLEYRRERNSTSITYRPLWHVVFCSPVPTSTAAASPTPATEESSKGMAASGRPA